MGSAPAVRLSRPLEPARCPDCQSTASPHFCGLQTADFDRLRAMCWYCWRPVEMVYRPNGTMKGYPDFCSPECRVDWDRGRSGFPGRARRARLRTLLERFSA